MPGNIGPQNLIDILAQAVIQTTLTGSLPTGSNVLGSLLTDRPLSEITSAPLSASATYTQAWQDAQALGVSYLNGSVVADQAGALYVDTADDENYPNLGASVLAFTPATAGTPSSASLPWTVHLARRYFRFRYVNGATAQGTFELFQTPVGSLAPEEPVTDLVPLAVVNPSTNADFAAFTAPFSGKAFVTFGPTTASVVLLNGTPIGGSETAIGTLNSGNAIIAGECQSFTIPISKGAAYAFQIQTAQASGMTIHVQGVRG